MEAYLDNCVVSGTVRGDLATAEGPAEGAAIRVLKKAVDEGRLRLVTSRESHREQERTRDATVRGLLAQARPDFPLVPENEKLLGINTYFDGVGGFMASPMLTEYVDADLYEKLKREGLKDADARHLMYAVHNKCDRFVTTDPGFLSRCHQLAALCGDTRIVKPSDLAAELYRYTVLWSPESKQWIVSTIDPSHLPIGEGWSLYDNHWLAHADAVRRNSLLKNS
jgi:hypothetical protein